MKRNLALVSSFLLLSSMITSLALPSTAYAITIKGKDNKSVDIMEFYDTKNHSARAVLKEWADYEIISGDGKGNFMPNNKIKRKDLACIFDRLFSLKVGALNTFSDLPNKQYYTNSMLRANAAGLILGDGKKLNPEGYATREELAAVMTRAFKLAKFSSNEKFVDDASIASWAKDDIYTLKTKGYWEDVAWTKVRPKQAITRAEFMVLLDNIVEGYYTDVIKTNGGENQFSNKFYKDNALVNRKGVEIFRSTISNNVYVTQNGCKGFSLNQATISGTVVMLGDEGTLSIKDSKVTGIDLYGKTAITGVEGVNLISVHKWGTGSTLDAIPETICLDQGVKITVKGHVYENNTNTVRVLRGNEINEELASNENSVEGGPTISADDFFIDSKNRVSAINGVVKDVGKVGIKEVGVVWLKNVVDKHVKPSLSKNDDKETYSGDYTKSMTFNITNQKERSVYAYRFYVIDNKGLIGYADTKYIESYDYSTALEILPGKDENSDAYAELTLKGYNIPPIASVSLLYGDTDDEKYAKTVSLTLEKEKDIAATDEKKYRTYSSKVTFEAKNGEKISPYYWGYSLKFSGKEDDFLDYPDVRKEVDKSELVYKRLVTGTAEYRNSKELIIKDNLIETSSNRDYEIGVVVKETKAGVAVGEPSNRDGWSCFSIPNRLSSNSNNYYDCNVSILDSYSKVNYAAYAKDKSGKYHYSNVRSIENSNLGDEGGPELFDATAKILSDDTALLTLSYRNTSSSIDMDDKNLLLNFKDSSGNVVNGLYGKSLKDLDAYVGDGTVIIPIKGLSKSTSYNVSLKLKNAIGYSNTLNTTLNTANKEIAQILTNGTSGSSSSYIARFENVTPKLISAYDVTNAYSISVGDSVDGGSFTLETPNKATTVKLTFEYTFSNNIDFLRSVQYSYFVVVQ